MGGQIIDLQDWFQTPPGRYLLAWERAQLDVAVADMFGYHALQLGLDQVDALKTNRMPYRWTASSHVNPVMDSGLPSSSDRRHLVTDFAALPFAANSLDLVVLPHTLELNVDPHATLREVERVLVPEGRVIICGLNPASLWGLRQRRVHLYQRMGLDSAFLPPSGDFIGYWRLRDWLRLLSFEVEVGRFGCYRPAVTSEKWLNRFEWMDRVGAKGWPIFGAVYFLVAVKRVRGMRLHGPLWKTSVNRVSTPVTVANRAKGR
jgi:SAM-dependent methyltransferase